MWSLPSRCFSLEMERSCFRGGAEFVVLMNDLKLPPPRLIDVAVPANQRLGMPHGG
jgi:hypothetical protein